ncbi:MAG: VWA domain-containing protein [Cyanobacteriota bacterium]|nr:VWA domain-containing protein [Cyanobacteriota bacterium]
MVMLQQIAQQQPEMVLDRFVEVTMTQPQLPTLDLISLHGAMVAHQPLNLSLVIDRSGSMRGQKTHYAREAARFAVENLLPCDRLSVVLFDDRIETLVPSTLGIGDDYSEGLLAAMARSGDGNFFHIESPDQFPTLFETELSGLATTLGQRRWARTFTPSSL